MQRMLQRHPHRSHELVEVINTGARRLLSMESGHRCVCRVASVCGLHRQPVERVGADLRLGKAVAHGLKAGKRTAELLALSRVGAHALQRGSEQTGGFGGECNPPMRAQCFGRRLKLSARFRYGKQRADRIAIECFGFGADLILTDGKAGTVESIWLDELHGLRISIRGHDGKWPIATVKLAQRG